jgi:hypothetical protein
MHSATLKQAVFGADVQPQGEDSVQVKYEIIVFVLTMEVPELRPRTVRSRGLASIEAMVM